MSSKRKAIDPIEELNKSLQKLKVSEDIKQQSEVEMRDEGENDRLPMLAEVREEGGTENKLLLLDVRGLTEEAGQIYPLSHREGISVGLGVQGRITPHNIDDPLTLLLLPLVRLDTQEDVFASYSLV